MLELINVIAAVGTFVVLGTAAVAALMQIRHLRGSNQLRMMLDFYRRLNDPTIHRSLDFVYYELPKRIVDDPAYLRAIVEGKQRFEESPLLVALWFDEMGYALRHGFIDREAVFELGAGASIVLRTWNQIKPVIEALRARVPTAFSNFEYASEEAQAWLARYPQGKYQLKPRVPPASEGGTPARSS